MEYFRRGHGSYGSYLVSFSNFVVIQYSRFSSYLADIAILGLLMQSIAGFAVMFMVIYVPVMIIVGKWDWKRITPTRQRLSAEVNPWNKDLTKALMLMCDGENEEAKKYLSKWI